MSTRPRKRARFDDPETWIEVEQPKPESPPRIEPTAIDYKKLCSGVTQRPNSLLALVEFAEALPAKGSVLRDEDYAGLVRTLCEGDLWMPLRTVLRRFPQRITLPTEEIVSLRAFKCAMFVWDMHAEISFVWVLYRMLKRARYFKICLSKGFSYPPDDNDYFYFYSPKDFLWQFLNEAWRIVADYWLPPKLPDTDVCFLLSK